MASCTRADLAGGLEVKHVQVVGNLGGKAHEGLLGGLAWAGWSQLRLLGDTRVKLYWGCLGMLARSWGLGCTGMALASWVELLDCAIALINKVPLTIERVPIVPLPIGRCSKVSE